MAADLSVSRYLLAASLAAGVAVVHANPKIHADDVTITSIIPAAGPPAGGDGITIIGTGFSEESGVFFGGTRATDVLVVDSETILAKTPAVGGPGTVTVTVINDTGSGTLPDGYRFIGPLSFSDNPLTPGTIVKAQHVLELRNAIDVTRFAASQSAAPWTMPLMPSTTIAAAHVLELRSNLEQALGVMHFPSTAYTDPSIPPAIVPVKAVHVQQLRTRLLRTGPSCTYGLSTPYYSFPPEGGATNDSVTTGASCDWAVTPDESWVTTGDGGPHTGSGSFGLTVSAGSCRQTRVWVGDQLVIVSQGCDGALHGR